MFTNDNDEDNNDDDGRWTNCDQKNSLEISAQVR